ncbi:MAG: DNA replication/repair protein RecF [Pseudomonadales bacterium]
MRLSRLNIDNIRNISSAAIEIDPKVNGFYGANGSGKTSLLEAIYFLGSARTFRSHSTDPLIRRGAEEATVFGLVAHEEGGNTRLGVTRGRSGRREIHIDGQAEIRASALAKRLPTVVLGPETVELLIGSPGSRRRFLNWGVFHVEPSFGELWEHANRCLKQRNRLLRAESGPDPEQLATWTETLSSLATQVNELRATYFRRYKEVFEMACSRLTGLADVECSYYPGWDTSQSLATVLAEQSESDRKRGYTQRGHHRADIRVKVEGENVANVCSRGELKILAWAMVLGQGWLLSVDHSVHPVYLIDDVASELDQEHRHAVCGWLAETDCQIFATAVDRNALLDSWGETPVRLFHVEQGQVVLEETVNE